MSNVPGQAFENLTLPAAFFIAAVVDTTAIESKYSNSETRSEMVKFGLRFRLRCAMLAISFQLLSFSWADLMLNLALPREIAAFRLKTKVRT